MILTFRFRWRWTGLRCVMPHARAPNPTGGAQRCRRTGAGQRGGRRAVRHRRQRRGLNTGRFRYRAHADLASGRWNSAGRFGRRLIRWTICAWLLTAAGWFGGSVRRSRGRTIRRITHFFFRDTTNTQFLLLTQTLDMLCFCFSIGLGTIIWLSKINTRAWLKLALFDAQTRLHLLRKIWDWEQRNSSFPDSRDRQQN